MSAINPTPALSTVIEKAIAAAARYVRVALPASVQSYDASTQTCSAQPLVQDGVNDETGTRQAIRLPVVTSVPVLFPGTGPYSITWPLAVGDTVLLVFSSSSIDRWLALGGEVDPIDDRRHHVTDAVAIAGLRDLQHALGPTAVGSGLVLAGPSIQIGGATATDAAIKGAAWLTAFDTLITAIATAISTNIATGGSATATAITTALGTFNTAASSFLSAIVKIG